MNGFPAQFGEKPLTATTPDGTVIRAGDQVRLSPSVQADAFDLLLRDKSAIVESIEQDFEGRTQLTVTLLDDPGRDLGMAAKPGHRFFFRPEEVEFELPATAVEAGLAKKTTDKPILVAGIGNIFLGDDAFGVEVARRLAQLSWPARVRIVDFGIRGTDLAFALLNDYAGAILIDAVSRGGTPGTLYVLEPTLDGEDLPAPFPQAHAATPHDVIRWARSLGGTLPPIKIVGCEPASLESPENGEFALSPRVSGSLEAAVRIVRELITDFLS